MIILQEKVYKYSLALTIRIKNSRHMMLESPLLSKPRKPETNTIPRNPEHTTSPVKLGTRTSPRKKERKKKHEKIRRIHKDF